MGEAEFDEWRANNTQPGEFVSVVPPRSCAPLHCAVNADSGGWWGCVYSGREGHGQLQAGAGAGLW